MSVLDKIENENDIKKLSEEEIEQLPGEIRKFILQKVAKTGGHLASNLGVVELTIALHLVLNFPEDKLIWDVGHQSYTHKILTGRKEGFDHLRQYGGMSGFPKRCESDTDAYETGHSSTSISAGLGFAEAREIRGDSYTVVSVIGDGALTGGLAYEALNNASRMKTNFIIVLNDNEMSISPNVGGLATHLASIRTAEGYQEFKSGVHNSLSRLPYGQRVAHRIHKAKDSLKQLLIPGMIFENMGLTYLGPVDGHNIGDMVHILTEAKKVAGAVVVHVVTKKGKGYRPAALHPDRFHGTGPFDLATGAPLQKKTAPNYTDVFSTVITNIAEQNPDIVAITAAMADGTGLKKFRRHFPDRFFDVGIAEGHGVTFAAGLAASGMRPVFAVYSSFLQRGYDELVEDVCLQNLPVIFAVDRAGLVGADGDTHQGIFDLSYLSALPNMTVMAPKNSWELADMLRFAVAHVQGPVAIRYPRGRAYEGFRERRAPIVCGRSELLTAGKEVAVFAVGSMVEEAQKACQLLHESGIDPTLINARFVRPLDTKALRKEAEENCLIVTVEENVLSGGFGESVVSYLNSVHIHTQVLCIGIHDRFVSHGSVSQLRHEQKIDAEGIAGQIENEYRKIHTKENT